MNSLLLAAVLCLQDDPSLKSFDEPMQAQLRQRESGGALAVVKDGRLVYAKGFGLADVVNKVPVEPTSLFRIASLSKPITAAAILKLAQDGKLDLDAKAFSYLDLKPADESKFDPRLEEVTVRHLLQHTGGLPGTSTLLVRRNDGLVWAAVFNERLRDEKLDPGLHKAADAVKEWPKTDLFEKHR